MNNLAQLLQDTDSSNNQTRNTAEQQLRDARDQDPGLFVLRCSEAFKSHQLSDSLRPKAGILIKYSLLNSSTGPDALWKSLPPDINQQIKASLLEASSDPNEPVRNVAADLISIIYVIELSWNG